MIFFLYKQKRPVYNKRKDTMCMKNGCLVHYCILSYIDMIKTAGMDRLF